MRWKRVKILLRLISLITGVGGLAVAWYLTRIGSAGIEDVPPPFILPAGFAGLGFLCIAVIGHCQGVIFSAIIVKNVRHFFVKLPIVTGIINV